MNLQVDAERDRDVLSGRKLVRIRYRERGTRRWTKFVVVLQEGQTWGDILSAAKDLAEVHATDGVRPA